MFKAIENVITWAAKLSFFVGGVAIILMMFHISGEVVARSLFNSGLPGTLAITSEWYMIIIVYMPLALLMLRNQHISVDLFTHNLSARVQHWLRAATGFGALIFFYYWADASLTLALKKTKRMSFLDSGLLQIPTWPVYWLCFVAVVLLALATVVVIVRAVLDARRSTTESPS
ncbi:TRAP transporter small permease [Phaeobacter gallaeciensis]|uniref:TRAP transporter small permease n=1 Tax=Phaeobacter gallaeciensis TaxID=60890 RepID=UPI00237EFA43|nr:TRAP transporter small permease [Phaeobacter gallaeciensis]MDE4305918.1 TRAP transporter small permease [Phaeobacter gallaeciensis]MDE4310267.1 TRAP transporter small permease [Phaeobacter gallaeciensis]MDE4314619.1 TRAP transporter small permease [Phaeobacter gallaeciensis]MDE4319196.1 TRAP transporter small permease [Phaeobacter gallaeciensis]MDE4323985.1 TRAP transporter small permease [Phaeobacter gallaeciensis]